MCTPKEVHEGIYGVDQVVGLWRGERGEISEGVDIGTQQADAAHVEPAHHRVRGPVAGDALVEPGVEHAFEGGA